MIHRAFLSSFGVLLALSALGVSGCKRDSDSKAAAAAPSSSVPPAPIASGLPANPLAISKVVNPKDEPVYSGPAGAVHGVIHATGDAPPEQPHVLARIPDDCAPAREVYGKLFREGPGRTLADVLVAVTEYKGYVPERRPVVEVPASGCAWASRTIALTFGQRLEVVAKDRRAYVPDLVGSEMGAQIIALPGGSGSALYPQQPGRFVLVDSLHIFSTAEVLVLKYATHDVTGLDGRFSIEGIPAGHVKLNVLLPATGATLQRDIEITPSRTLELDLELPFDRQKFEREHPTGSAAPSSSAPGVTGAPKAH